MSKLDTMTDTELDHALELVERTVRATKYLNHKAEARTRRAREPLVVRVARWLLKE